jgi:hypothetical protein
MLLSETTIATAPHAFRANRTNNEPTKLTAFNIKDESRQMLKPMMPSEILFDHTVQRMLMKLTS